MTGIGCRETLSTIATQFGRTPGMTATGLGRTSTISRSPPNNEIRFRYRVGMSADRTHGVNAGEILNVSMKETGGYFEYENFKRKLTMGAAIT